jgi:hypothetical protein
MSKNSYVLGAYNSNETKAKYIESLQTDLMFHFVYFNPQLVSANPIPKIELAKKEYKSKLTVELFKELHSFMKIQDNTAWRIRPPLYSGKVNTEGRIISGKNDDKVITLAMCSYWAKEITREVTTLNVENLI